VAGTFLTLRFELDDARIDATCWPVDVFRGIALHARGRATERAVHRLGWGETFGAAPEEWEALAVWPADLGASDIPPFLMHDADATLRSDGVPSWPASPWTGACLHLALVPGQDGFPEIFGSLSWLVFFYDDRWHVHASIEYPSSSVGRDERWLGFIETLAQEAQRALGCRVRPDR
jgi:hypothetical protein